MDDKAPTGASPPYEVNAPTYPHDPNAYHQNRPLVSPMNTGSYTSTAPPQPENPSYANQQHLQSSTAPTQYPHQPIPPPGQHSAPYDHTPMGSPPPPAMSTGPVGHPPPAAAGAGTGMGTQIHQAGAPTPPLGQMSPGQEKHEYYSPGAAQGIQTQQQGVPMTHIQSQPQQQGQYNPGQPQPQSQYQTAVPLGSLQKNPAPVDCPSCHHRTMTRVEAHSGNVTHVWALVLGLCLCLCCVPYFIKGTKDVEHKCGHCGTMLACYHNSGHTEVLSYA